MKEPPARLVLRNVALASALSTATLGCWFASPSASCTQSSDCPNGSWCDLASNLCFSDGGSSMDGGAVIDGGGPCMGKPSGAICGRCEVCDSDGGCTVTPNTDSQCEPVSCALDAGPCRTYHNITTALCKSFGQCKTADDCANSYKNTAGGTWCDAPRCNGNTWQVAQCDGDGGCVPGANSQVCDPYRCEPLDAGCPTSCVANAGCVAQLCDLNSNACPDTLMVNGVDCTADAGALQAAIGACSSTQRCYLLVQGVCGQATIHDKDIYIGAGGADAGINPSIVPVSGAAVLAADVSSATTVTLAGLTIQGAINTNPGVSCTETGHPVTCNLFGDTVISNTGAGVSASAATVTVEQSTIQSNGQQGIALTNSAFTLINNIVAGNGTGLTRFFGVDIFASAPLASATFEFNTVAANGASGGLCSNGGGVSCAGNGGKGTTLKDSLLWNTPADDVCGCTAPMASQIGTTSGACGACFSSPDFVGPTNFRLQPASQCVGMVSCDPSVKVDIDGDPRPRGTRTMCTVGADEPP
jgi:parallel beta-helix repeat protein